jgi:hypothetical protein
MDNDIEIYKNKKFSDLCKDIVKNSENNRDQLDILISDLRSLIKTANDALMIVPLIKEYLDVQVKNDEQLVKLAAVIQRILSKQTVGADGEMTGFLTEDEKRQLMKEIEVINTSSEIKINKSLYECSYRNGSVKRCKSFGNKKRPEVFTYRCFTDTAV